MRTITLSLLAMVLVATLGLGWLFDNIYQKYQYQQQTSILTDDVSVLEDLGQSIAHALDELQDKQKFITRWQNNNGRHLSLLALAELPLPPQLMTDFIAGKPLVLATTDGLAIHYYLPQSTQVLVLTSPVIRRKKTSIHWLNDRFDEFILSC